MNILSVIGTRPQYIKVKPIYDLMQKKKVSHVIADTCQHYDDLMSASVYESLGIEIDERIAANRSNSALFVSDVIANMTSLIQKHNPSYILVYGDTNSTLAGALAAKLNNIPLAHVESGLRSGDVSMPEEINRIIVDNLSDVCFCPSINSTSQVKNSVVVGDLEYESAYKGDEPGGFGYNNSIVVTIHRQENQSQEAVDRLLSFVGHQLEEFQIDIYTHHSTKPLFGRLPPNVFLHDPITPAEMKSTLMASRAVITDSGGIQKMLPFYGKRGIIYRSSTEWREVCDGGYGVVTREPDSKTKEWLLSLDGLERNKTFYLIKDINNAILYPSELIYQHLCGEVE